MSRVLDELHHLITDLEGEGHSLAGRFRDAADRLKADFEHLTGGKSELDAFVKGLVASLVPEVDRAKVAAVAEVLAEVHKVGDEIKTAVEASLAKHTAPAATAAAPAPVEPPKPAPAQG